MGLSVKSDGSIFVADNNNNRIMKFDNEGEGSEGITVSFSELNSPVDVKINNGVYILDINRIYKLLFDWLKKK